ncbi:MAG: HAD family hydrolase [Clostridia bacterium]|jgi:phosphoglycolate phosphatase|nr:HAD family hydrolase [Clostridia bacterium]NLS84480.1 HAD family hydrolase [Oscillospiraceae bacterium]
MYKAVIFDLDGTLLNTIDDLADAGNHVLSAMGLPTHETQEYRHFVGNGMPKLVERILPEQNRGEATKALGLKMYIDYYTKHSYDKTAPYDGIVQMLANLKAAGVLLGVVSNKEDSITKNVIAHYFPNTFHIVSGHIPNTPTKPDPHLVVLMRETFGTSEAETLYVGDSNVDMITAKNANLDGCGVLWGFRTQSELIEAGARFIASEAGQIETLVLK